MQKPVEINDQQVVAAKDEAVRRAKGKGYLGTILTGFQSVGNNASAGLQQILGQ
jgi:hypothetical protein